MTKKAIALERPIGTRLPKEFEVELRSEWVGSLPGEVSLSYYKDGKYEWGQLFGDEHLWKLWWKTKGWDEKGKRLIHPRFHATKGDGFIRLGDQIVVGK